MSAVVTAFFLLSLLTSAASASWVPLVALVDERLDRLSDEHKSWLERDVVYIITERERDVFLTLESVDERNRFIEAFWRKRDPNRATPVNEFRQEHYRRLDYANTYLGRETFREGWQTDRGRFYIILGEPREIQRFDGYNGLVSAHLWFYQGERGLAVPSFFYLLFFKRDDIGEYQLYHPMIDGPHALLTGSRSTPTTNNTAAIEALRKVSPELAAASLSLDPSEPADFTSGRPNIGTDMMIARIEAAPKRPIRTDYADAGLRYGNRVSADYTFNFVPSRSVFSILADPATGTALVNYSIEIDPQNFSLETDEDGSKFYTTLDVTVEARTQDGTLVFVTDKEAYIELTPAQVQEVRAQAFAYQDDFALVPGDYTVSVIVRNRVLTQFTVAEAALHIPRFDLSGSSEPALTDVILAFDTRTSTSESNANRVYTYEIGELRIHPAAEGLFVLGDTVHLVTQAMGASSSHRVVFELRHGSDRGEVVRVIEREVGLSPMGPMVVDHMKLDDMVGGDYQVIARLVSPSGEVVSTRVAALTVSPRSFAARPGFVYRRGLDTRIPGLLSFLVGEQLWNLGRYQEATAALEAAVATGNEQLVPAKWKLANAYLKESRADDAFRLLKPLEEMFSDRYEVMAGLGFALYLKDDFAPASLYLARARALAPPDTMLLNALGDSYQKLGKLDEAREAFERSLELDRGQPAVKARLAGTR
ncbi:MAG: hypothetical protein BMS9Abin37_0288 [Acidobacteriota bacterium]|nr:MAG: hypothetical protein BMS9Abin37_0288 [Acidobacteriota bacterium]